MSVYPLVIWNAVVLAAGVTSNVGLKLTLSKHVQHVELQVEARAAAEREALLEAEVEPREDRPAHVDVVRLSQSPG